MKPQLKTSVFLALTLTLAGCAFSGSKPEKLGKLEGTVVLLHGLWRNARAMVPLERTLSEHGYQVTNLSYPSRAKSIPELSQKNLHERIQAVLAESSGPVHFVTHSMGGVLLRYYLKKHPSARLGRVVMLSPPSQGTEIADLIGERCILSWIVGPAGKQLGTAGTPLTGELGAVDYELGVIAGARSYNPLFSCLIPGEDDGMIPVERTKVEGMKDFLVVDETHSGIRSAPEVHAQVLFFLRNGEFQKEK